MTITFVPMNFSFPKKQKHGFFGPNEKVLLVKIDLHKNMSGSIVANPMYKIIAFFLFAFFSFTKEQLSYLIVKNFLYNVVQNYHKAKLFFFLQNFVDKSYSRVLIFWFSI